MICQQDTSLEEQDLEELCPDDNNTVEAKAKDRQHSAAKMASRQERHFELTLRRQVQPI